MVKNALFVYGSFMTGMVHHGKVQAFVKEVKPATVLGTLYRLPVGYPTLLDGTSTIHGELLVLDGFKELIKIIDEFEGFSITTPEKSLYLRVEREVMPEGAKKPITAHAYLLNPVKLPKEATVIETGNWKEVFTKQPPLSLQLNDSQKKYILKLGASSGRDIVPINLDIYRDLLNKGLIIDKGRRLALTNLGVDVFRFLAS